MGLLWAHRHAHLLISDTGGSVCVFYHLGVGGRTWRRSEGLARQRWRGRSYEPAEVLTGLSPFLTLEAGLGQTVGKGASHHFLNQLSTLHRCVSSHRTFKWYKWEPVVGFLLCPWMLNTGMKKVTTHSSNAYQLNPKKYGHSRKTAEMSVM